MTLFRDDSALHALRRLPTIASALSHHKERFPNDVSTRGDVDACSRASRACNLLMRGNRMVGLF